MGDFMVQECRSQERFAKGRRRQRGFGGRRLMKSRARAVVGLTVLSGLLAMAIGSARAEESSQGCDVPSYLVTTESSLSRVTEAAKSGRLDILVIGSRSSTINASEASAYPARLQAALLEKLPSVEVNVAVEIQVKKTAEETAGSFVKL